MKDIGDTCTNQSIHAGTAAGQLNTQSQSAVQSGGHEDLAPLENYPLLIQIFFSKIGSTSSFNSN